MSNSIRQFRFRPGDETGFTLIELLIAITIFAVGLLAVAAMQISAISGNKLGGEWTRAATLAQMHVEALKSGDLTTGTYTAGTYVDPNNPLKADGTSGGIYNRSWQIIDNTAFSKQVIVFVRWIQAGIPHVVTLTTVTKGGGT